MATNVYFGCCPNCPADFKNAANVSISSGVATFSAAQAHSLMGVGAVIDYDVDNKKMYVSGKTSTSVWSVVNADGTTPADISGKTVNSITHPFVSLLEANTDTGALIGGSDLTVLNLILNLPQYCEQSTYTADAGGETNFGDKICDSTRYVYVYTPSDTDTECNLTMRSQGNGYDGTKPRNYGAAARITITNGTYVKIRGFQIFNTGGTYGAIRFIGEGTLEIDQSVIIYRGGNSVLQHTSCINIGSSNTNLYLRNSIMMSYIAEMKGIYNSDVSGNKEYYGNIFIGCTYVFYAGSPDIAKNNIIIGSSAGSIATISLNNLWRGAVNGGVSDIETTKSDSELFTSAPAGNYLAYDFSPLNASVPQVQTGADLSSDTNANDGDFNNDSGWRPQGSAWDIGAFEMFVPSEVLFVSQRTNKHILKKLSTASLPATYTAHFGNFGIPGVTDSYLNFPIGIAADDLNNIYICDSQNKRIVKLDSATNLVDTYDTTNTVGEPQVIMFNPTNGDIYVAGIYGNRVARLERMSPSLVSTIISDDLHVESYLKYPFVTGISKGFVANTFVLTGINEDLQIVTESGPSFSVISQQTIDGEEPIVYKGVIVNPIDSAKIILNNGRQLITANTSFACIGRSNEHFSDPLVGPGIGKNNSLLMYNSADKKLLRYNSNMNFIEEIYEDTGSTVALDAKNIPSFVEFII